MATKATPKTIGKVGQCEVVDYEGTPCLKLPVGEGRHTIIGPSKIKTVLANSDVCKAFLAQYDKPKAPAAVKPAEKASAGITSELAKQIAEMQAKIAALTSGAKAPAADAGRFQPEAAAAAA